MKKGIIFHSNILSEQENFYKNVYGPKHLSSGENLFFDHDVKLNDEQRKSCEGNL